MATKKTTAAEAEAALPSAAEARNELARALRVFQAFQAADKALALLENLEQVTAERTRAADDAMAACSQARAELAAAQADRDTAAQAAKDMRAKAKKDAGDILDKANADAHAILEPARQEVAELQGSAKLLRAEIAQRTKDLGGLQEQVAEAHSIIERAKAAQKALAGAL